MDTTEKAVIIKELKAAGRKAADDATRITAQNALNCWDEGGPRLARAFLESIAKNGSSPDEPTGEPV